jgi:hypothetical protein
VFVQGYWACSSSVGTLGVSVTGESSVDSLLVFGSASSSSSIHFTGAVDVCNAISSDRGKLGQAGYAVYFVEHLLEFTFLGETELRLRESHDSVTNAKESFCRSLLLFETEFLSFRHGQILELTGREVWRQQGQHSRLSSHSLMEQ